MITHEQPRVMLDPEQITYCDKSAVARNEQSFAAGAGGHNGHHMTKTQAEACNIKACRAEGALFKYLGGPSRGWIWHAFEANRSGISNMPDIEHRKSGEKLDGKSIDAPHKGLLIKAEKPADLKPLWRYVLISTWDDPYFDIIAWIWGWEVRDNFAVCEPRPGQPAWLVPQSSQFLHPVPELLAIG
jgi:hypothetical protein